jgi:leader peptidase (prepilin peptidase)/N-methyltransferase
LVLAALAGLLLGSFLNVCIHRMPRDLSIVWPHSYCVHCRHGIAWYDNIPLVSYLLLRGRCRHCLARIHWRYPVVEAFVAALFCAGVLVWGPTAPAMKFAVFAFLQVGMIFSDLETRLLPDQFTKGGIAAGLVAAWFTPVRGGLFATLAPTMNPRLNSVLDAAFAAAAISGALWFIGWAYAKVRRKEGLGFGDVKMAATMGAFLGLPAALLAVFFGCLAGSVLGLAYIRWRKKDAGSYELPFGSFLGVASIVVALVAGD